MPCKQKQRELGRGNGMVCINLYKRAARQIPCPKMSNECGGLMHVRPVAFKDVQGDTHVTKKPVVAVKGLPVAAR